MLNWCCTVRLQTITKFGTVAALEKEKREHVSGSVGQKKKEEKTNKSKRQNRKKKGRGKSKRPPTDEFQVGGRVYNTRNGTWAECKQHGQTRHTIGQTYKRL